MVVFSFCELKTVLNSAHLKKDTWAYQKDTPAVFFVGIVSGTLFNGNVRRSKCYMPRDDMNVWNTMLHGVSKKVKLLHLERLQSKLN